MENLESRGSRLGEASYNPVFFEHLFAVEDRHFWFKARNRAIAALVQQVTAGLPPGYRVLEIGCGTGNVLRVLEGACSNGQVFGLDLFAEGLQYARRRTTCPLVQGDLHQPPFGAQFELIGLFDVLEHLRDDTQVLQDLWTMLAPQGTLILTVPAHSSLWSYFDEASYHCRRYERADFQSKLTRAGYRLEYLTEYMASTFPLVWLGRRLPTLAGGRMASSPDRARRQATDELSIMPVANGFLDFLLALEARLIARRWRLPIGASLMAIARKDST